MVFELNVTPEIPGSSERSGPIESSPKYDREIILDSDSDNEWNAPQQEVGKKGKMQASKVDERVVPATVASSGHVDLFPTIDEVQQEVDALAVENLTVPLPSSSHVFPDSRTAMIHMYSAISHQPFEGKQVILTADLPKQRCHKGFRLVCSFGRDSQDAMFCPFRVNLKPLAEGEGWAVVKWHREHNHEAQIRVSSDQGRSSKRKADTLEEAVQGDRDPKMRKEGTRRSCRILETSVASSTSSSHSTQIFLGSLSISKSLRDSEDSSSLGQTPRRQVKPRRKLALFWPTTSSEFKEELNNQLSSGILPLPSKTCAFTSLSHQVIRAYVIAAYSQRGCSVRLRARGRAVLIDEFQMKCGTSGCTWTISIELKDGKWRCANEKGSDSHVLGSLDSSSGGSAVERRSTEADKDDGNVAATIVKIQAPPAQNPSSLHAKPPIQQALSTLSYSTLAQPPPSTLVLPKIIDSTFLPTLAAILYGFSPSLVSRKIGLKLVEAGLNSLERIESLIWMERDSVRALATLAGLTSLEGAMLIKGLEICKREILQ